jgi:hypothetical protein
MTLFVQRQLCNEGEAPGPVAHPILIVLYQSDGLDPVDGTNDRTVAAPDLGRVRDIPDIGFLVRGAPPHSEPQAIVITAVAEPLHGNGGTLRLDLETDQMSVVGADLECCLTDPARAFVVHKYRVDLNVVPG